MPTLPERAVAAYRAATHESGFALPRGPVAEGDASTWLQQQLQILGEDRSIEEGESEVEIDGLRFGLLNTTGDFSVWLLPVGCPACGDTFWGVTGIGRGRLFTLARTGLFLCHEHNCADGRRKSLWDAGALRGPKR